MDVVADSVAVASGLERGVRSIFGTQIAFAAVRDVGKVEWSMVTVSAVVSFSFGCNKYRFSSYACLCVL